MREGFTVDEVVVEDGRVTGIRGHGRAGQTVTERARVVVGADGRALPGRPGGAARAVPREAAAAVRYYSYWSGLPMDGRFEIYVRPTRAFAAWPTNDDLTLVIGGWPFAEFEANKRDIEGNFLKMFELAPEFAERIRGATREARFVGTAVPNFFRKPFGPGWALVGDAGYNKDFITAQGIQDAFRDAELCATALDQAFAGARRFDEAMAGYQSTRDEHVLPMYEFTCQLATLEPPPPELQQLLGAMHGNQEAMDGFARVNAGVTSPAEFFAEENVGSDLRRGRVEAGELPVATPDACRSPSCSWNGSPAPPTRWLHRGRPRAPGRRPRIDRPEPPLPRRACRNPTFHPRFFGGCSPEHARRVSAPRHLRSPHASH